MADKETQTTVLGEDEYLRRAADAVSRAAEDGPVPVDPDVAEHMGAFEEDALSAEDALDSHFDGVDPTAGETELDYDTDTDNDAEAVTGGEDRHG